MLTYPNEHIKNDVEAEEDVYGRTMWNVETVTNKGKTILVSWRVDLEDRKHQATSRDSPSSFYVRPE
jgi:hypothetical protein